MSKLKTKFPRLPEMTDEEWKKFCGFNSGRRCNRLPELDFYTWKQHRENGWKNTRTAHNKQQPENVSCIEWNRYIAFRSYRRGKGLPIPTFEEYVEYYSDVGKSEIQKYSKDPEKLKVLAEIKMQHKRYARKRKAKQLSKKAQRVIAKINAKVKNARMES